jgi:CO/xanthine dehydrogenase Mo-binding subunit
VLDADAELVFLQEPQLLQLAGNQLQGVERAVRKLAKALGVDPAELISAE